MGLLFNVFAGTFLVVVLLAALVGWFMARQALRGVDEVSRAALIEGGALGPELEAALKPHGLTLRHFPQSFQFSTLGGWLATRAGGHFATNYTHIDDFVESIRLLTPGGVMESRRLPGSCA